MNVNDLNAYAARHEVACASLRLSEVDLALRKMSEGPPTEQKIALLRNASQEARLHMEHAYSLMMAGQPNGDELLALIAPVMLIPCDRSLSESESKPP
jgi:hypothetical protein